MSFNAINLLLYSPITVGIGSTFQDEKQVIILTPR